MLDGTDFAAIWLTVAGQRHHPVAVAAGHTAGWWLARTRSRLRGPIGAVVALPLVLPPTVLGFYLLVALGPNGPIGQLTQSSASACCHSPLPGW